MNGRAPPQGDRMTAPLQDNVVAPRMASGAASAAALGMAV
eukprot:CAMPEP_0170301096 /NCGR_PEP_ID=MMETSP0116_2-20130129/50799_1 /TAXON_ID=400756 /ORGANISM="Durinskia baltica, Strain CSIRO CS-38" /LENGTH=39 /DNA_ID= /DNA_START= /DNA_END= /DNA_ORIENTATION=